MPFLFFYATKRDSEALREWINAEPEVAWIVKVSEQNQEYVWKATNSIDSLPEQQYALWHFKGGPLNIPSGNRGIADAVVADPFNGWAQTLTYTGATSPWFGANLPGPYNLTFAEAGCERAGNLARSEFSWLGDHYRSIGKPAHPDMLKWWQKLRRFLAKSGQQRPLFESLNSGRSPTAYVFPDAHRQLASGRGRDENPWLCKHRVQQA